MRTDLAALIDHTLLRPDATRADVERLCSEAAMNGFAYVCVNSIWVAHCAELLADNDTGIVSTVGFPLGACNREGKVAETKQAIADGASEIDMVAQLGWLKEQQRDDVIEDIRAVVDAAEGRPVKVILETSLLSDEEKRRGAAWVKEAGAAFVKTSSGYAAGGATLADVRLLREAVGADFGVKASGGVHNAEVADAMIAAGANRLGTSAGVAIVTGTGSDGGQ